MAKRQAKYGPFNYERILGSRNYTFTAEVDAFVQQTEKRMNALIRQATQDLINEVQMPVAKGGKMRVDTGFLRASGQLSLTGMPTGPAVGDKNKKYSTPPVAVAQLSGFTVGKTLWFGWTANYAAYREAYDGFLISGIQNWQAIVNRVCEQIKQRSPANRVK